ncbi:MAG: hypothetical protein HQK89_01735 [Nitrospirae bacterium]|nr:hypothetical protein [Nitrospirota bacterium]
MSGTAVIVPVLVDIGVDIAVSLYNSYQNHKNEKKKTAYLQNIKNNFKLAIGKLKAGLSELDGTLPVHLKDSMIRLESFEDAFKTAPSAEELLNLSASFSEEVFKVKREVEDLKLQRKEAELAIKNLSGAIGISVKSIEDGGLNLNDSDTATLLRFKEDFKKALSGGNFPEKVRLLEDLRHALGDFAGRVGTLTKIGHAADFMVETTYVSRKDLEKRKLMDEATRYIDLIRELDTDLYAELSPVFDSLRGETVIQRLESVRDTIKLKYGRMKEDLITSTVYKNSLPGIIEELNRYEGYEGHEEVAGKLSRAIDRRYLTRGEFEKLADLAFDFLSDAQLKLRRKELAEKISDNLKSLGYEVIGEEMGDEHPRQSLEMGRLTYVDTQWPGYKVMLRLNDDGSVATRLVRVVATEEEKKSVSTYQRVKDRETASQWCTHYDKFLQGLRDSGLGFTIKVRKEPEEEDITYVVNEKLLAGKKQRAEAAPEAHPEEHVREHKYMEKE